jgi:DNA gyrase/topoisomerase IV subunit B
MAKEIKIDLKNYYAVQPQSIINREGDREMYDLVLNKDNTFHVRIGDEYMLTHNCDGQHINSLLINLIFRWFPFLIDEGRLFILDTPVITAKIDGKLNHFYDADDFYGKTFNKVSDKTYIKGLGALDTEDWKIIFANMHLLKIYNDKSANKYLNIAFGLDAKIRKKWLENKI